MQIISAKRNEHFDTKQRPKQAHWEKSTTL